MFIEYVIWDCQKRKLRLQKAQFGLIKCADWYSQKRKLGSIKNANWEVQKRKVFSKRAIWHWRHCIVISSDEEDEGHKPYYTNRSFIQRMKQVIVKREDRKAIFIVA
jgi:hypothetical protein